MWTWLPAGWRAHRKVEQVREELDAIGAAEMLMPVLPQPAELWKRSGRYDIDELSSCRTGAAPSSSSP